MRWLWGAVMSRSECTLLRFTERNFMQRWVMMPPPTRLCFPKRPYIERGHIRNYSNLDDILRILLHTYRVTPPTWCTSMSLWHFFHDHAKSSHLQPYYLSFTRLSDHFDTLVSFTFPLAGLKCLNLPHSRADTPLQSSHLFSPDLPSPKYFKYFTSRHSACPYPCPIHANTLI